MLKKQVRQASFHSVLYDKIPKDHVLLRIKDAVDFSFVNALLADSYCKDYGRPAFEPELMLKLLLLQHLYNLSDVRVIEEASVNLAYLCFLDLNPDDTLPDASLLAKFRTQRLKDRLLDDILTEIVRQCVDKGIVKGGTVSVDATHIEANTKKKVPERVMRHLARKIFTALEKDLGSVPETVDTDIPDVSEMSDHNQARAILKDYLEDVMRSAGACGGKLTGKAVDEAREVLADEKFILQKGQRSLADSDARVGYKSKKESFFGYKSEFAMTAAERVITAVNVKSGEYTDGTDFNDLMDKTIEAGVTVDTVDADKAYFRKPILDKVDDMEAEAIIPVSASVYKIDEDIFSYNKDSDEWVCALGNRTVSKKLCTTNEKGKKKEHYRYVFDAGQCLHCSNRAECMGKRTTKARRLEVGTNTAEFYEISQSQKDPEFLKKYKQRATIEGKNSELKRFHGMARARGFGIESVTTQVMLTVLAVNMKRIAAIIGEMDQAALMALAKLAAAIINLFLPTELFIGNKHSRCKCP
jgi:transposase